MTNSISDDDSIGSGKEAGGHCDQKRGRRLLYSGHGGRSVFLHGCGGTALAQVPHSSCCHSQFSYQHRGQKRIEERERERERERRAREKLD